MYGWVQLRLPIVGGMAVANSVRLHQFAVCRKGLIVPDCPSLSGCVDKGCEIAGIGHVHLVPDRADTASYEKCVRRTCSGYTCTSSRCQYTASARTAASASRATWVHSWCAEPAGGWLAYWTSLVTRLHGSTCRTANGCISVCGSIDRCYQSRDCH